MLCWAHWAESLEASGTAANPGFVGIWEYPTAEMPEDGGGRFGYAAASPYAFYYTNLAWLPWLEINARLTTFDNVFVAPSGEISTTGVGRHYMDKAIDVKTMLHRSRRWFEPSLAVGVADIMGTELMKSWYGVATWRAERLAFSMGYGTDRMNGFFGGVSWDAAEWLTLKAEYSPMNYSLDSAGGVRPHSDAADAKYNVGFALRAPSGMEASLSWQRGEEFVFSLSKMFDLNGPFLTEKRSPDYGVPGAPRIAQWKDTDPEKLGDDILEALSRHVRVRDVEVAVSEGGILVAYENYGHASDAEAMVRVLVLVAAISPHVESVTLIPRLRGIPAVCAEFPGEVLFGIRARDFEVCDILREASFSWADHDYLETRARAEGENGGENGKKPLFHKEAEKVRAAQDLKAMLVYEPRIDQTLDDDYQNRWSVDLIYENRAIADGWAAIADVRFPLVSDVDIWWEPDMNEKIRIQQAAISRLGNYGNEGDAGIWSLTEAGWLDEEWFGLNQWGRLYSRDGRWWGGVRVSVTRERDPMAFAGLASGRIGYYGAWWFYDNDANPWRTSAWLQGGFSFPEQGLEFSLDYGKFIDEDIGGKVTVTRRWDDVAVGFWLSWTDVLAPGKDFTNAGVHLELPAEKWFGNWLGNPSAHVWDQEISFLSTWVLESARQPGTWGSPERMLSRLRPAELKRNVEKLMWDFCAYEGSGRDEPAIRGLTDYFLKKSF
ncbi:MAG: YjbH domain-containing protein [Synergistaceae bacterium]|nr:YjbH domain-containing protein [Synergistaceae bacterium]